MSEQFCGRCFKETGKQIPAAHVTSLGAECERHFHGGNLAAIAACRKTNPVVAPASSRQEDKMPKRIDPEKIAEIKKDFAAGMSIEQIRKKHNVSWLTAKNAVEGSARPSSNGATGGAKRGRQPKRDKHSKPAANGDLFLTVPATHELCDERWSDLSLENKVRALNALSE